LEERFRPEKKERNISCKTTSERAEKSTMKKQWSKTHAVTWRKCFAETLAEIISKNTNNVQVPCIQVP
jgi:hypothetical protein